MIEIIRDLRAYLAENYKDRKDFLTLAKLPLNLQSKNKASTALPQKEVVNQVQVNPNLRSSIPKVEKIAYREQMVSEPKEKKEEVKNKPAENLEKNAIDFDADKTSEAKGFITNKLEAGKVSIDPEMKRIYQKIAPHIKLHENPLDDQSAQKIRMAAEKRSSLPSIPIFFDHSIGEHLDFLTSLAKAINTSFGTSSVVNIHEFEEKNLWKPLLAHADINLILIPQSLLKKTSNLQSYVKEYPGRVLRSLEKIPLLPLTEISDSPIRKKEIWALLTKFFSKSSKRT
jgi:hypothetical protein